MAILTTSMSKEVLDSYDGFDITNIGPGLINPDIYKTPAYSKKKIKKLLIGTLASVVYGGAEHDRTPLIIPIHEEFAYQTVLAINMNYLPVQLRMNIARFILETNKARIASNLPIMIDYQSLKRAVPEVQYVIRRYKQVLLGYGGDGGSIPLSDWGTALKQRSRWENHYRVIMEGRST
jgi:hypothetical protein